MSERNANVLLGWHCAKVHDELKIELEIAQSEQDVSPFCKESDMTYS